MPLEPNSNLLHYRLLSQIGEGGMGVVWKAVDTTLDREVAIKILPEQFAADPERLSRFEREAKLLASLNHPNIAAVYGLHEAEGVRFLAMELAAGEDLEVRLSQGPMAMADALDTARQIAEALEAAHEQGIIHRDLKPANVLLGDDGKVKVLDFGLAKALDPSPAQASGNPALSPTMTSAGTVAGVILGTAAYMSPEQARGKPVNRRSDLWAFGCVLYEMLTGKRLFKGETISDTLAAVLRAEPDWSALPPKTPRAVHRLLRRCLSKDPGTRLADAGDARLEITDGLQPATEKVEQGSSSLLPWSVAAVAILAAVAVWMFGGNGNGKDGDGNTRVVAVEAITDRAGGESMPALSPDGHSLAYVARDGRDVDIFLQRVGGENPVNLTADHDGWDVAPAFSPDGQRIAFASEREGGGLFVMGATGESPRRVASEGTHPSWSPDGTRLVAATEQVNDPYSRSTRSRIFIVDIATGDTRDLEVGEDGVGPRWSPDGQRIAYWTEIGGQRDLRTIAVDGGAPVPVTQDPHTDWEPLWSPDSRALYFHSDRGGSPDVWRVAIDPDSGLPEGDPEPVTIGVMPAWESSLSADGSRLVVSMRDDSGVLMAFPFDPDRQRLSGEAKVLLRSADPLKQPNLSPDGSTLVYRTDRPWENIVTLDLATGNRRRLTDDHHRNRGPVWSGDGNWLAMYSNRDGRYQAWRLRPDGTGLQCIREGDSAEVVWDPKGDRIAVNLSFSGKLGTVILQPDPASPEDGLWVETDVGLIEGVGARRAWSDDGRYLLVTSGIGSRSIAAYDFQTGEILNANEEQGNWQVAGEMSWFADNIRVLGWGDLQHEALIWNVANDRVTPLPGVPGPADLILAPDDRTLYVNQTRVEGDVWMLT
ncbi:MAG: PD40 domain-containing protein, partial [Acidobacteria bacterium]|nr:PD40 domain-containing protein [Candidatus Polarisedimenticola svalbardensis]